MSGWWVGHKWLGEWLGVGHEWLGVGIPSPGNIVVLYSPKGTHNMTISRPVLSMWGMGGGRRKQEHGALLFYT